ncbi:MAG: hypothetical protein WCF84_18700 [Anaerolineae bacterium]
MTLDELTRHEQVIAAGKEQFVKVGMALIAIRDQRGYKLRGFETFEEYCEKQHGFTRRQGYRLMEAAEVAKDPDVSQWVTPANERQARALSEAIKQDGKEAVVERIRKALDTKNPEQALSDLVREHREAKKTSAPRYEPHEDAQPDDPPQAQTTRVLPALAPAPARAPFDWSSHAISCTDSEESILRSIMALYLGGARFDWDCTYSEGKLWDGVPGPLRKSDLTPNRTDVEQADARQLPTAPKSLDSIFFDPPHVAKDTNRKDGRLGIIEKRFSGYKSMEELWRFYREALHEFYRVLRPGGVVAVKCMDVISGGKFYASSVTLINDAIQIGFDLAYQFVLYHEGHGMMSPNMQNQQNPRHNHCYYLVLVKK